MKALDEIIRKEAPARNVSETLAREYLTERLAFDLGEREYAGMRLFLEYARDFATLVSTGGAVS
jgi:predicted solute-binding protein